MPPGYVMDEMRLYEMGCLMPFLYLASKDSWEQARFMGYISAQTHSTKSMKPSDIMAFPWESGTASAETTSMSNADKERLIQKAKRFEQLRNGH